MASVRSLCAVVACRNNGSRLYGKPLQNLDVENKFKILDQVVLNLQNLQCINEVILAISSGSDNISFIDYASSNSLRFVIGDEIDVLQRLIQGLDLSGATDIFRVTSESPFLYWQPVEDAWVQHLDSNADATFLDDIIDGCGFEIITTDSMRRSWALGDSFYRSELCSLFIRHNKDLFNIQLIPCPSELIRKDLRLTVDYPEDLIVCRSVYSKLVKNSPNGMLDLLPAVDFLDNSPQLKNLIAPYTEAGYSLMYH